MSTGEWKPGQAAPAASIDQSRLDTLIALADSAQLQHLATELSSKDQQWLANAMSAAADCWLDAAEQLTNQQIASLIKALAIAEMCLPGCTVGDKSPVIYLNRVLKARNSPLSQQDLLWLKEHSNNRFLPNGPI